MISLKRVYEPVSKLDGCRVLVERLWPRGIRKDELALDAWAKELSPSPALRTWYAHDIARWPEFVERYTAELDAPELRPALDDLASRARSGPLTLLFAARDPEHCSAAVLRDVLEHVLRTPR